MNRVPLIIAIMLLLLPVLYVGSYLALVVPGGDWITGRVNGQTAASYVGTPYRWKAPLAERVYWPLEQIDRKVRPGAWQPFYLHDGGDI